MRNRYLLLLGLFICMGFTACKQQIHLVKSDPRYYTVDGESSQENGQALSQLLSPYQEQYAKTMNDVIGHAGSTLKKGKPESTLGNWLTDVLQVKANANSGVKVDFSIQNYGGIRINELQKGDITRAKIYELMPFDNMLVIVEFSGSQLQEMLDKMAASGGWPASSSLRMNIENKKAIDVNINGEDYDPNSTYHVAMPDYIANGGDGSDFLIDLKKYDTGRFIRDLLIEAVEEQEGSIDAKLDGRMKINN